MIKSLVRWGTALGVAGVAFISWGAIENLSAIALPEAEILKKLDPVPVFAITDESGVPLVAATEKNKDMVSGVFISKEDANQFVEKLKTENPELAAKVKVVLSSLGQVYKLAESVKGQENPLSFAYVPNAEAISSAKTITQGEEQSYQGGVPLFVATGGENKDPLSIEQNNKKVIPFFFDKQELEAVLGQIKEKQPEIADSVTIDVILLENVIETLKTSQDQTLADIVLVPSVESIEAAKSLQGTPGLPATGEAAPEAAPADK
jgi:hypothetical protein